ncbi:site-2 protease family protein [Serpentinicella alkaliphila]|uniref:Zn-dependent protease n=1 Tax=Serpentinicella alkaliphila TaxID=1734049 RepID=A0A4R2T7P0_9FIRM|nr:site-2 protease family protein [Serpentinicella alkaliphila]QUH26582.1 site-2 protease family protein [Serpentinicella alkaliphila]TCP99067.1 Zn-dependent protease [Serpentinicella alkaliphila]
MFNFSLARIVLTLPGILLGLTIHEYSHALSAYYMGDDTAKYYGRLSLNPIKHIDPIGFLMLLFAGFGWAKPVPVNPNNFKNRKLGYFLVSISGPLSNFILAILLTFILGLQITMQNNKTVEQIIFFGIYINLVLGVFNLFPIPPLDGSKLLLLILPDTMEHKYYSIQKYSYALLFLLLYFGVISKVLFPIVQFILNYVLQILIFFF